MYANVDSIFTQAPWTKTVKQLEREGVIEEDGKEPNNQERRR